MCLSFNITKHICVASDATWDKAMANAIENIVDLGLNAKVLERFNVTQDDLAAMEEEPKTWVELAVLQIVGDDDLLRSYLPDALDVHRLASRQSSAHLNLVADNTYRPPGSQLSFCPKAVPWQMMQQRLSSSTSGRRGPPIERTSITT